MKKLLLALIMFSLVSCASTSMHNSRNCPTNNKKYFYDEMGTKPFKNKNK